MSRVTVLVIRLFLLYGLLLALPAAAAPAAPGWYRNSSPAVICDNCLGLPLKIVWEDSYIYQHPGADNLYWYAQVKYINKGSRPLPFSCSGATDPSLAKEHMRGTPDSGDVSAEEALCSRNPNVTGTIKPGELVYEWAIFHNVPPGGEVRLEWYKYGFSPWVNPWYRRISNVSPPAECPRELVWWGTCQHDGCVFRHDNSIVRIELGHVAWGWRIAGSNPERWVFGSTDSVPISPGGPHAPLVAPGQPNGSWTSEGSFANMRDTFRNKGYREFKCRATNAHAAQAARQQMTLVKNAGYSVIGGNNCMNHTAKILNAYGENNMDMPNPDNISSWRPDDFFNQMGGPWQYSGL